MPSQWIHVCVEDIGENDMETALELICSDVVELLVMLRFLIMFE